MKTVAGSMFFFHNDWDVATLREEQQRFCNTTDIAQIFAPTEPVNNDIINCINNCFRREFDALFVFGVNAA